MTIRDTFYLPGFTRQDMGEEGAIFIRYTEEENKRAPEIRETPMFYGGANTINFTLSIPAPRPPRITACAVITRTSKNCYSATVFDERRIMTFKENNLSALLKSCTMFFKKNER